MTFVTFRVTRVSSRQSVRPQSYSIHPANLLRALGNKLFAANLLNFADGWDLSEDQALELLGEILGTQKET